MGYITPITQYEYIQYANRTVNAKKQPQKAIQGVIPIKAITFMQELEKEIKDAPPRDQALQFAKPFKGFPAFYPIQGGKSEVPGHLITRMTADLTGKGGVFNETI